MAKCGMKLRPTIVMKIILLSMSATLALSLTDVMPLGANVKHCLNSGLLNMSDESVLLRNATHHVEAVGEAPDPLIPFELEKTEETFDLGGGESNTSASLRHELEVKQFVANDTEINRVNCRQMGDPCNNYADGPLWLTDPSLKDLSRNSTLVKYIIF
ncbi:hypothetical protein R1sor_027393 [Riccia sorocarpa]|uniref:Uncharacterized protein n=1 Tax=Riccia sorocarpa TaxID=122646 RepID=A0ABD3GE34_9MARC